MFSNVTVVAEVRDSATRCSRLLSDPMIEIGSGVSVRARRISIRDDLQRAMIGKI